MELLQHRVWSLEEELDLRVRVLEQLQVLLPECQRREREQLEFKKSAVEEQMARAQRAVSGEGQNHPGGLWLSGPPIVHLPMPDISLPSCFVQVFLFLLV